VSVTWAVVACAGSATENRRDRDRRRRGYVCRRHVDTRRRDGADRGVAAGHSVDLHVTAVFEVLASVTVNVCALPPAWTRLSVGKPLSGSSEA